MDSSILRLDWLRSFLCFAETRSFTAAARRLHVSQPALFTQIRQLGELVGRPLYHKVGRQLVLTDTGREVEALARDVLRPIDRFARRLQGSEQAPPVISAGRATHLYLLAGPLRRWGQPMSLRTEDRAAALEAVRAGRADLAVTPMSEDEPGLRVTPLIEVGQVAIVPATDPLAHHRSIPVSALLDRPLVLPPRGRPHREAIVAALGAPPRVVVEVDGWEIMAHYAALGMGIAIVNATIPVPAGAIGVPVHNLPKLHFSLVRRSDLSSETIEALANHLQAELGAGALQGATQQGARGP